MRINFLVLWNKEGGLNEHRYLSFLVSSNRQGIVSKWKQKYLYYSQHEGEIRMHTSCCKGIGNRLKLKYSEIRRCNAFHRQSQTEFMISLFLENLRSKQENLAFRNF